MIAVGICCALAFSRDETPPYNNYLRLAGGVPLLASLFMSLLEHPFIVESLIVAASGAVYGILVWKAPNCFVHVYLLWLQIIASLLVASQALFFSLFLRIHKSLLLSRQPFAGYDLHHYLDAFQGAVKSVP
jgi:hypothetical protein